MKIIEYGNCVWDGPKENKGISCKEDFLKLKQVYDFTQDPPVLVHTKTDEELYIIWEQSEINNFAQEHIYKYYPSWKQSNVLREGNEQELLKMSNFINAVRAWSNQESPDPWNGSLDIVVP
jgi:hypothetical protein